jgi:hypothetical protein
MIQIDDQEIDLYISALVAAGLIEGLRPVAMLLNDGDVTVLEKGEKEWINTGDVALAENILKLHRLKRKIKAVLAVAGQKK